MEQQPIPATMSLPIRKQMLGLPITFSDLEFVDADLHRNLLYLQQTVGVEALCLDFTVTYEAFGKKATFDLLPNGESIQVTDENKDQYLQMRLQHRMLDSIKPQLEQLLKGLYEVVPPELLSVFDYQELELLMCGIPEIDVADWIRHTEYLADYHQLGARHKVSRGHACVCGLVH
jgi:E3 ubiquitin ligase SMURF1/2